MNETDGRSLLARLEAHRDQGYLSLHMPGHKENATLAPYFKALGAELDITELPDFDDLHAPEGILKESMARAAALFGARRSFYQVNGSTGALLAAIRGATRRGDKILMARHCHKAVYHAVELCGLEPVYLLPPVAEGLSGPISPEMVRAALAAEPDVRLVVYPSPTYDGILSDTAGICAAAHEKGVPVLVDEAHGAHLGLWEGFPQNAMQQGADLAVASLHKLLPSLTQTAILHVGGGLVPLPEVERQTGIFQSSSPSYLLLASMDACVGFLETEGPAAFAAWGRRLKEVREGLQGLQHLRLVTGPYPMDPAKLVVSTRHSALNGVELKEQLRETYKIELEMALDHYAVAMTGLGSDDAMPGRLSQALLALDAAAGPAPEAPPEAKPRPPLPPQRMKLEDAARQGGGFTFLYDGMGKISGEYIWAYPPGIPLITPGEEITVEVVETVEQLYRAGVKLIGTRGKPPFTTVVVE